MILRGALAKVALTLGRIWGNSLEFPVCEVSEFDEPESALQEVQNKQTKIIQKKKYALFFTVSQACCLFDPAWFQSLLRCQD